ncbi:nuclease-related domain-containing DEAD/DEAH box helicase [Pseudohongiella spirulinae]|uniref:DNA 3'-5' helicase II n=1 Tax=Pseudohongiella spirulinae TaxID=1249552 RepID=A0A0S2KI42_9GAMM|nr:NERD domain-containing protein [Pseudohongiella spirulinae]ALO47618.1 hypothetical protein PS2015_2993 [Pseudohongiella spirulinae]
MAVIWPRKLPRSILDDPRRKAEVRVYNRLADVLDDSFHVFYSSPWLGTDRLGNEKDGECDFLVAHPLLGILAIEVKGGKEISFDPADGLWRSTDHYGFIHKIKDPVAQARSAKHEMLSRLNSSRHWPKRKIYAAHGVIFPSVASPLTNLGSDKPAAIFCCAKQFNRGFLTWIRQRLREGQTPSDCKPLGHDGVAALTNALAHPFRLSFRVGAALSEAAAEFSTLEPSQYHILEMIQDLPRALIKGGAGTGKTVLAIQEAIGSAQLGYKTLFVCHGRSLARYVKTKTAEINNLFVLSFHELCGFAAHQAGIQINSVQEKKALYNDALPNSLYEAVHLNPSLKWDSIVVDEGQDFKNTWWIAIEACINKNGRLRVFMDSNQQVYGDGDSSLQDLSAIPIRLTRNLRNTKNIHNAAMLHYFGPMITADGPDGLDVNWIIAENHQNKLVLAKKELRRLIINEDAKPSEIAILVNSQNAKNEFLALTEGSGINFTDADNLLSDSVVVDTVLRFKGLERPAVILLVLGDEIARREFAYVAISRAKAYLAVVASNSEIRMLSQET